MIFGPNFIFSSIFPDFFYRNSKNDIFATCQILAFQVVEKNKKNIEIQSKSH